MAGSRRLTRLGSEVAARAARAVGGGGSPAAAALSGGADSAVLAWALLEAGRRVRAVHIHHGWPASDRMEAAAGAVAGRLGIGLTRVRVDASGPGSPEAAARSARYAALEAEARAGELIATGHTLTDQAETVLGNLMRGAGLDGLRGIRRRRGRLARPMLDTARGETRELAVLLGLPFTDDPANQDPSFRRVRIRRALAAWERTLAPGIGVRLAELADLADADLRLLDELGAGVEVEESGGWVRLPAPVLNVMPPAAAARAVRRALRAAGGGYPGVRKDVEAVLAAAGEGGSVRISGGRPVERAGVYVRIGVIEGGGGARSGADIPAPLSWDLGGAVRWGGWTWKAQAFSGRPAAFPFSEHRQVFDARVFEDGRPSGGRAVIRAASPDDRIAMRRGRKRVFDALAESGIPPRARAGRPVLEAGGRVVWIPGVRRAYTGWAAGNTIRFVEVSAVREEQWKPVEY